MKKALVIVVALFLVAETAFGFSELLTYLKGHADADAITLDWQSGTETGVKSYAIERSSINSDDFREIGSTVATGNNSSYHYRDANVTSMQQQGASGSGNNAPLSDLFKYRLKINYGNAISYSQTITVTRPSAGVKRTWGMIKEMFR